MYRVLIALVLAAAVVIPALAVQTAPPPAQPQVEDPPPVLTVPSGYRYDPRGRRDPFVNPIPRPTPTAEAVPAIRPPGLRGVLMAEANLLGIVTSSQEAAMNRVVIGAPGGRTYFGAIGDPLFDAVIKEIRPDAVVFTLTSPGGRGQQSDSAAVREVVRRINPVPGENQ